MPPALSATSTPPERTSPAGESDPSAGPAPAREKPAARRDTATQARPGSQPADDARLLHELDQALAAITERRRAAAARAGTDGAAFADIRAAFTALRQALDLPGPAGNGDTTRPAAAAPDAPQPASPPPEQPRTGPRPPPSPATSPISGPPSPACGMSWACPHPAARTSPPLPGRTARRTPAGCWTRPPRRPRPAPGGTATPRNGSGCPGSAGPRGNSSQQSGRRPGTTGPRSSSTSASGVSPGPWPRGRPWRSPAPPTSSPAGWSVPGTATRGRGGQPGACTRPPRPSPTGS